MMQYVPEISGDGREVSVESRDYPPGFRCPMCEKRHRTESSAWGCAIRILRAKKRDLADQIKEAIAERRRVML